MPDSVLPVDDAGFCHGAAALASASFRQDQPFPRRDAQSVGLAEMHQDDLAALAQERADIDDRDRRLAGWRRRRRCDRVGGRCGAHGADFMERRPGGDAWTAMSKSALVFSSLDCLE
jgi:hypothetical protein